MRTVLELLNLSSDYLEKKNIESARMNAELLLAEVLNCKRLDLYLAFNRPLSNEEVDLYRSYIARRSKFEPLQYIIGYVEFYNQKFEVNEHTLIPRPETEILMETVINTLENVEVNSMLDIGTGTGVIPITYLCNTNSNAKCTAIDKNSETVKKAKANAKKNLENPDMIRFLDFDIFSENYKTELEKFDVIISNPPYVSLEEYNSLQKEITKYEPADAVTDNDNGYTFYERIITISKDLLNENGKVFFEIGAGQSEKIQQLLVENNFCNIDVVKDYQDIDRVISGELK